MSLQDATPPARGPLNFPVFRALWIATIISNIGTWMHDVGAGWLMTSLSPSPLLVALVQAATTLPMFLLALPAGAMADIVDRRKMLLGAQILGLVAAGVLAFLTLQGLTSPWVLLAATFVLRRGGGAERAGVSGHRPGTGGQARPARCSGAQQSRRQHLARDWPGAWRGDRGDGRHSGGLRAQRFVSAGGTDRACHMETRARRSQPAARTFLRRASGRLSLCAAFPGDAAGAGPHPGLLPVRQRALGDAAAGGSA